MAGLLGEAGSVECGGKPMITGTLHKGYELALTAVDASVYSVGELWQRRDCATTIGYLLPSCYSMRMIHLKSKRDLREKV